MADNIKLNSVGGRCQYPTLLDSVCLVYSVLSNRVGVNALFFCPQNPAQEHNYCPTFASWKPRSRTHVLPSICVLKISLSNTSFVQLFRRSKNNFEHEYCPTFPSLEEQFWTRVMPNISVARTTFWTRRMAIFPALKIPLRDTSITQHSRLENPAQEHKYCPTFASWKPRSGTQVLPGVNALFSAPTPPPQIPAQGHNYCPTFASWKPHSRTQVLPSICVLKIWLSKRRMAIFPSLESFFWIRIFPHICVAWSTFVNMNIAHFPCRWKHFRQHEYWPIIAHFWSSSHIAPNNTNKELAESQAADTKMATQKLKPHGTELHKNWREFCVPIKGIGVVWIPEVIRLHHEGS